MKILLLGSGGARTRSGLENRPKQESRPTVHRTRKCGYGQCGGKRTAQSR